MPSLTLIFSLVSLSASVAAATVPAGESATFISPNGIVETCTVLTKIPGGVYSKSDEKKEKLFCSLNLYEPHMALCPKTWSTSPGTIIHNLSALQTSPENFEATSCKKRGTDTDVAKFKQTMNQNGTSGTFSQSSLLYYHVSRFFDVTINVPPSVYRSIDKNVHLERVTNKAHSSGMNAVGWAVMKKAEMNPSSYVPTNELFTDDYRQIYGILLKDGGTRYGAEINGIRSAWGDAQNNDFQKTAPFLALKSSAPLDQSFSKAETQARQSKQMNIDLGKQPISPEQMVFWTRELLEITLLDYMFNQQDRIGNIDYKWVWYYHDENGVIKEKKDESELPRNQMIKIVPPSEIAQYHPILLQRTFLGDNDAGGKREYANYTQRTHMLEGLQHYNADLYRHLIRLAQDFQNKGELYHYIANTFILSPTQVDLIVKNTLSAADILRQKCEAGTLTFDIPNPMQFLETHTIVAERISCTQP